ncbi:MAG TPA: malto-oligosyltrehalose synthase [Propionicimonas sp.]|uniref:malto-oligosyltrehalose synthase n=1 Tax=Propionicimonas sp. TaxID=1955623 RepID=UPI002F405B55
MTRTPASTYRLQITEDFDLVAAARTVAYLHELGVDWVYLSPLLASETGSDHGYDVSDHRAIDPSRGRASGLAALATEAKRLGMGVLVDIVPNHVGVARPEENEWWWHVLTLGQESPYASAFDIDWAAGGGKLRIPVVGDDDLLPDGHIDNLTVLGGELHYHDQRFPLAPDTARGADEDPNAVHARQHYELISWREADSSLNYRRFFAVNTLVALRVEDPEWFTKSHAEIKRWFDEGLVDGLRVDHPDGLRDPGKYLEDLATLTGGSYVLVEKILAIGRNDAEGVVLEPLPSIWATAGTTGYDALALIDRVLVDPAGEAGLTELENRLRGRDVVWSQLVHESKLAVAYTILNSEVRRIAREVLAGMDAIELPDFEQVVAAVAELLADFEVYRSYLPEGREHLDRAFGFAWEHRPDLGPVLDLLYPVLADGASGPAQRFQQTSGMVMAKAVEDGAFYRWSRLTSLNEVGGDPDLFSVGVDDFHRLMGLRQQTWPAALTAGTTHDTKRGEDVRARISVLSEVPGEWAEALAELQRLVPMPDPGFANLLWQAVVGVWPADRERLHAYAEKAMREGGDHTGWTAPDAAYESAVQACIDAAFDDPAVTAVLERVANRVAGPGWVNALSAKMLDLTIPGVPDLYQGSELWELSLVDPDNRRPVDFAERVRLLTEVRTGGRPALACAPGDVGEAKLLLVHQALTLRRDHAELFTGYTPLAATGAAAGHLVTFDRGGAITLATRLPVGLDESGGWGDTVLPLPEGRWRDEVSGRLVATDEFGRALVAEVLADYPVALLVREERRAGERGRFDVWAPLPKRVRLQVANRVVPMTRSDDGWWTPSEPEPLGRVDYGYLIDDLPDPVPDPRSRWLPFGVHGLSRTFEPSGFAWHDHGWTGRQLAGGVVYELHVGTFTPEGTLDAAIGRLPHLVELGVDFVELMPVNAFNGEHGWGYDGVAWFAVHEPYGGPDAYRRFVDAAHSLGLAVVQDVVYNHLGPSGNYLPLFGPYLTDEQSGWGSRVNLDGEDSAEVRRLICENLRHWFVDLHVDALRLDAVHALVDESRPHLLEEMAQVTADLSAHLRRPLTLIAESDLNDPRLITPVEADGYGIDAQWSDDFHHALHVALTGETQGYYADFEPLSALAKVCERGFFHDGSYSSFRERPHGQPLDTAKVAGWRLVVYSSDHDQVGNRARGDRPADILDIDQLACAALVVLTSPFTPMVFQGEEWAGSTPFPFFASHPEPDLGAAVTDGRLAEFARMEWDTEEVPDPQDPETFASAKLNWAERADGRHKVLLDTYRELITLRRQYAELTNPVLARTTCQVDEEARWFLMRRGGLAVVVNFGEQEVVVELGGRHQLRWATPSGARVTGTTVVLPPHAGALLLPLTP